MVSQARPLSRAFFCPGRVERLLSALDSPLHEAFALAYIASGWNARWSRTRGQFADTSPILSGSSPRRP